MGSNCSGAGGGSSPCCDAGHDVSPPAAEPPPELELPPQAASKKPSKPIAINRIIIVTHRNHNFYEQGASQNP
jgi:hypothetical protein